MCGIEKEGFTPRRNVAKEQKGEEFEYGSDAGGKAVSSTNYMI